MFLSLLIGMGWGAVKAEINNQTLAVLVNKNDPESLEIAKYYQKVRGIPDANIIVLNFKFNEDYLSESGFKRIKKQLEEKVANKIQAYVLAWRKPWRVDCMSITSAFSLGFNNDYCSDGCSLTKSVEYFNSSSNKPYDDYGFRPSMMLSGGSLDKVKQLIDAGVESDYSRPVSSAYLMDTSDKDRNVRSSYYPHIKKYLDSLLNIEILKADAIKYEPDVLFYFTGTKKVRWIETNNYFPGAIADHLTSTGGKLFGGNQMSIVKWIDAGVTGTYGTVVEPCNYRQKFPNPGIVMQKYLSGETLIESYWKSVKMPGQGVFVGEPLAAPFKGCLIISDGYKKSHFVNDRASDNYVSKQSKNCHLH